MQELELYNTRYESGIETIDYDKTHTILSERTKETFQLEGISGIDILNDGIEISFDVKETDDNLIALTQKTYTDKYFISKNVFTHLSSYLGIPTDLYNYINRFKILEDKEIIKECCEREALNFQELFNYRLQKVLASKRVKNIFITVFDDVFGRYPRVIHSEVYFPYPDVDALETTENGLLSINKSHVDRDYQFSKGFITPYQSEFSYTNKLTKTPTIKGEEIESGIANINSECKQRSLTFRAIIKRLICSNGLLGTEYNDLRVRHFENGFYNKIKNAFIGVLNVENEFAHQYLEAAKFDTPIAAIEDWSDLMDKVPSSILAMKPNEKQILAETAKEQGYNTSPYGLIQAITYKSSHGIKDENTKERYNSKALHILDNIETVAAWNV